MRLIKRDKVEDQITVLASIEDLTILLMRPWLTRRWVVQELALSRSAILHCGAKTIAWDRLAFAASFLRTRRLELTYMRIRELYMRADPKTYRRGYLNTLAAETLASMSDAAMQRVPSPSTHLVFHRGADLEYLLSSLSSLQCTNPLDTVCALLAIASDASVLNMGPPDYAAPIETIYQNAGLHIISMKHSLNILCQRWAAMLESRSRLPGWIQSHIPAATRHEGGADSTHERRKFVGDGRLCRFRAAGRRERQGTPGKLTDYEGMGRLLMVTGIIVDVVEYVGEGAFQNIPGSWRSLAEGSFPPPSPEVEAKVRRSKDALLTIPASEPERTRTVAECYAAFADLGTAGSRAANSYSSGTNRPVCQTLFADGSPYRSNNGAINIFEVRSDPTPAKLHSASTGLQLPTEHVHTFLDEMATCVRNRAVARTCTGKLALVDAGTIPVEEGDVIAVLFGRDVPVVLRLHSTLEFKTRMSHGVFEFVGEAYVQSVMYGEVIEQVGKLKGQHAGSIFLV